MMQKQTEYIINVCLIRKIFTDAFKHLSYPFTAMSNKNNECSYLYQEALGLHFCSWLKVFFSLSYHMKPVIHLISFAFNRQNGSNFFFTVLIYFLKMKQRSYYVQILL